jgi:hypothetical protein
LLVANVKELFDNDIIDVNDPTEINIYDGWMKSLDSGIDVQEPRYGWSGYDENTAKERFDSEIHDLLVGFEDSDEKLD